MTSVWPLWHLTLGDVGKNVFEGCVELMPGEVLKISKRYSQPNLSYWRKTNRGGGPFGPLPSGRGLKFINFTLVIRAPTIIFRNRQFCPSGLIINRNFSRFTPSPGQGISHKADGQGGGGGVIRPPWRLAPALRDKNQSMRLAEILTIPHNLFSPRSIFDLVRSGQRSNFREISHYLHTLIAA